MKGLHMIQAKQRHRFVAGIAAFVLLLFPACSVSQNSDRNNTTVLPESVVPTGPFSGSVENARFRVELHNYMNEGEKSDTAFLIFTDKQTGVVWNSSPPGADEDPLAKNARKMAMKSLMHIRYADADSNLSLANSAVNSRGDRTRFLSIPGGVRVIIRFENEGITVPMDITLMDDYLKVSIPVREIEEDPDSDMRLVSIIPLPYFGALQMNDDGYMLVPDGSGALIDSSRIGSGALAYKQYIYGRDPAIEQKTGQMVTQTARLPVYGIKKDTAGMLGIIHTGASRACINAELHGTDQSYHCLNTELIYRDFATVDVGKKTYQSIKINLFESEPVQEENFEIRLYPLSEEQGYVGMATRYREYLLNDGGVTPAATETAPLYVELFGGVKRQVSVLGLPMDRVVPVTSFADALTLINTLQERGVGELVIGYTAWGRGGSSSRIPLKVQHENALGSRKEWLALQETLAGQGIALYPDLNFTDIYKNAGFNGKTDGIKTMQKNPLVQYRYKLSTYQPNPLLENTFLLTPEKVNAAVDKFVRSSEDLNVAGFSVHTLGQKLYSDFGSVSINRMQTQRIWETVLKTLTDAGGRMLFRDPNAYAFPYAAHLTDVPVDSSRFLIESKPVPFYQIALHGVIPMTLPSLNGFSDIREAKLKALETGCLLKYTWGAQNVDRILHTEMDGLLGLDYSRWLDEAITAYVETQPFLKAVSDAKINSHRELDDNVFETVYDNGVQVIVNYSETAAEINGRTIPAMGYLIAGM